MIADTDALVTAVWHERYVGAADPALDALAEANVPDLYLVCGDEFVWVQDGTRESQEHRTSMQRSIEDRVLRSGADVVRLSGAHDQRIATALDAIEPLRRFPTYA